MLPDVTLGIYEEVNQGGVHLPHTSRQEFATQFLIPAGEIQAIRFVGPNELEQVGPEEV
jgi:hypothetical protein